jgi:hypothetical protein
MLRKNGAGEGFAASTFGFLVQTGAKRFHQGRQRDFRDLAPYMAIFLTKVAITLLPLSVGDP